MKSKLVLTGIFAGIVSLLFSAPAYAHSSVSDSNPKPNSTVSESIEAIELEVSEEPLSASAAAILLQDQKGNYFGDACVTIEGTTIKSNPVYMGEAGKYKVLYSFTAADGHPIGGEYSFTWQPESLDLVTTEGSESIPTCGAKTEKDNNESSQAKDIKTESDHKHSSSNNSSEEHDHAEAEGNSSSHENHDNSENETTVNAGTYIFSGVIIGIFLLASIILFSRKSDTK